MPAPNPRSFAIRILTFFMLLAAPTVVAQDKKPGVLRLDKDSIILTYPMDEMGPFEDSAKVQSRSAETMAAVPGCDNCAVKKYAEKKQLEVVVPIVPQSTKVTGTLRITIGKRGGEDLVWNQSVDIAPISAPKDGKGSKPKTVPQPPQSQPTLSVLPIRSDDKYSLQVGFNKSVSIPDGYEANFLLSGGAYTHREEKLKLKCESDRCDAVPNLFAEPPKAAENVVGKLEIRKGGNVLYTFITQHPIRLEPIQPIVVPPPPAGGTGGPTSTPKPPLPPPTPGPGGGVNPPSGWAFQIVMLIGVTMAAGLVLLLLERKKRLGEATSERIRSATKAKKQVPRLEEQGREDFGSQDSERDISFKLDNPAPVFTIASLSSYDLKTLATRLTPLLQGSRKAPGNKVGDSDEPWNPESLRPWLGDWRDEWLEGRLDAWYRRKLEQERRTPPPESRAAQAASGSEESLARIATAYWRGQDTSATGLRKQLLEQRLQAEIYYVENLRALADWKTDRPQMVRREDGQFVLVATPVRGRFHAIPARANAFSGEALSALRRLYDLPEGFTRLADYAMRKPAIVVAEDDGRTFRLVEKGLLLGQGENRTPARAADKPEPPRFQSSASPTRNTPSELETNTATADVRNELHRLHGRIAELEQRLARQEALGREAGVGDARQRFGSRDGSLLESASGEPLWSGLKSLEDAEEMASAAAARELPPEPVSELGSETPTLTEPSLSGVQPTVDFSDAATQLTLDPVERPEGKAEAKTAEVDSVSGDLSTDPSQPDDDLPLRNWRAAVNSVEYPVRDPDLPGYEEAVLGLCQQLRDLPRRAESQDLNTFMCQMALEGDRFKVKPIAPGDLDPSDTAGRKLLFAGVEQGASLYLFVPRGLQSVAMGRSYKKLVDPGAASDFSSGLAFPAVLERESSKLYRLINPMKLA